MNKKLKTFVAKGLLLTVLVALSSCVVPENRDYGDKILIVRIARGDEFPSDVTKVRSAFETGGQVTLDVDVLREINRFFDSRFTTLSYDGRFLVRPAILNFVGGQGWRLLQVYGTPREIRSIFL